MYQIDEIDRQIIHILQEDGRTSNVDVARQIGVTEGTIRKRLERLLESNIIRVAALLDPPKIGYTIHTIICLKVELSAIDDVIERLLHKPEVRSIDRVTGEFDVVIQALFPDNSELLQFLTNELGSIEGIHSTSTSHIIQAVKSLCGWKIPGGSKIEILIVDDELDFLEFSRTTLISAGYRVSFATNVNEALAHLRVAKPDLVVLDVMMEGILDGVNILRTMKSDEALSRVPVVMVSSIVDSPYSALFPGEESISVDNFLVKPVDPDKLISEVQRLLTTAT